VTAERADRLSSRDGEVNTPSAGVVTVDEATEVTPELVEAFERLVPQLSSSSPPPGHDQLVEIVRSAASILLVAQDSVGTIIGSLTLAVFRVPTGRLAWIEDVVVDESARGAGAGEALVAAAVARAGAEGAKSVDLTSRPSRAAANRLYLRMGFEPRATNVYRLTVEPSAGGNHH
jgi:ribosomal protein S18 acetylase RimI-like enzyme